MAHVPLSHHAPEAQSAPVEHEVAHAPLLHAHALQSTAPATHVPPPSHVYPVTALFWHVVVPHGVPCAYNRHAPFASHCPSLSQLNAPSSEQSSCGSEPAFALPQVPSAPEPLAAALQAWHAPVQAELQQKPSTQNPESHALGPAQGLPGAAFFLHVPWSQ
jgi:hypothetical protein